MEEQTKPTKSVGEILDAITEALDINYTDLANRIGLRTATTLYHSRAGKSKPGYEILQGIVTAFPQVNAHFLLTGEGEPLHREPEAVLPKDVFQENRNHYLIMHLDEEIKELRRKMEALEQSNGR